MKLQCPNPVRLPASPRCLLLAAAFSLLLNSSFSQTSAASAPDSAKTDDEAIVLSPFVVDASQDVGYRATNTLAGTRISTNLRDVAAPVSVVTKDFMNDIGASDVNDILAFQTGSEGTRDFTATVGQLGRTTDGPASNPNGSTRGRGLAPYDITRDYFFSIGNAGFDSYNLDSVTISRGPNSVLAGLGSPSGIINYSPQLAQTGRNFNEITYRFGSYGDQRATINSNYALVKDKLALRFAGLAANAGFKQQPAYSKDRRLYLAGTWQPASKTTVRASYEWVQVKSNLPNTITPEDDISQWIAVGKPTHAAGEPAGLLWDLFGGPAVLYNPDGSVASAYNTTGQLAYFQQNYQNIGLWQASRFNNNAYGDWDSLNTNPSTSKNTNRTFNISVDQQIIRNLNVNVAFVHEEANTAGINLFRPDYVALLVDVNRTLPWGAPNPHLGETFMDFRGLDNWQTNANRNNAGRITATYNLDLNQYNKWLGRYSFVAFSEKRQTDYDFKQYNSVTAAGEETHRIYYLGGNDSNGYKTQTTPRTPYLVASQPYFDTDGSIGTLTDGYVRKSNTKSVTKLGTIAAVFQGYLWDDRIVPMIGIRRDVNRAKSSLGEGTTDPASFGALDEVSATTTTYGVVVHPLKWLDLYYNKSENFVPNAGTVDLLGNAVGSPIGESKDYGFSVSLLDNKLSAKLGWYETKAAASPSAIANFPLAQWVLTFQEVGYSGWNGGLSPFQDLANKAGVVYKRAIADGIIAGDSRLANAYTSDQVAKGLELELTYNVNKNWRIFLTASKQEAIETNIAHNLTAFIEERVAYWKSVPGLWTGQTTTASWNTTPQTGEELYNANILPELIKYQAAEGKPSTQLAKWRGAVVTNYMFSEGPLKGFNAGAGLRYIAGSVIGNPVIRNSTGDIIALDTEHPYENSTYVSADVWVGYTMHISHKYKLGFTLRVQDLQSDGNYRPIYANADGSHAIYTIKQPRQFYLSTKLEF